MQQHTCVSPRVAAGRRVCGRTGVKPANKLLVYFCCAEFFALPCAGARHGTDHRRAAALGCGTAASGWQVR